MYDSVDDTVYFMKKDYQLKPEYIASAEFTDSLSKPKVTNKLSIQINIDMVILILDDCSWTCSYDQNQKHGYHSMIGILNALPSINHFFTTKTTTTTTPQCLGYNFNPNRTCEIGVNTTEPATITVDEVATVTGGASACLIDLVVTMDTSGSTLDGQTSIINALNTNTRARAQMEWLELCR